MKNIRSQRGQAIIMLAFAVVVLVGFAALAIDGGRALSDKRHAQNAADTSAFAAALAKIYGDDYEQAAILRAASNGYNNGPNGNGSTSVVEVDLCSELALLGTTCQGMPAGADPADYIRVKITSTINTTFARVIGRPQVTVAVEAIAHASGVTSNPLVLGAALAAFKKDGTPFDGGGSGDLTVLGSGVFSNSSATSPDCTPPNGSMKLGGAINYHVDTSFAAAGTVCKHGGPTLDGPIAQVPQVDTPKFNISAPSFTCKGPPASPNPQTVGTETVYQPGTYNGLNLPPHGNFRFASGSYCFDGNVKFNGGTVNADGVSFRMTAGAFTVGGTTVFNCSNMIVHTVGGTGVKITGGTNNCNGVTFYIEKGDVELGGNTTNTFNAPTIEPYKGLLIYLPEENKDSIIKVNGNSSSTYTGSIIGVASDVTINGDSKSAGFNVQVLADTIKLTGGANITIIYNPDQLYNPPQYPTIELSK